MAEESEVTFDVQAQLDLPQVPFGNWKMVIFHSFIMYKPVVFFMAPINLPEGELQIPMNDVTVECDFSGCI